MKYLYIFKCYFSLWCKAEFSAPLFQLSVSRDPSEITLICWFAVQETFLIIIINSKNSCAAFCGNHDTFSFIFNETFYSGAIESVLTQCISVWYNNATNQDCKALQRVVRLAERISGSALPSLQVIYLKRCRSRAAKIIKDSTHPGNHLFCLLPSGRRFRSMMAKTERLRKSFFPQAIRLLNTNSVS